MTQQEAFMLRMFVYKVTQCEDSFKIQQMLQKIVDSNNTMLITKDQF